MKKTFKLSAVSVALFASIGAANVYADIAVDGNYGQSGDSSTYVNAAGSVVIRGNNDGIGSGEGVFITSNGHINNINSVAADQASIGLNTAGNVSINGSGNTTINTTGTTTITGNTDNSVGTEGVRILSNAAGAAAINLQSDGYAFINANTAVRINAGAVTGDVLIGNGNASNTINGASNSMLSTGNNTITAAGNNTITAAGINAISADTNNITATTANNIQGPVNNIGTAAGQTINNIGNNNANSQVNAQAGNAKMTLANNSAVLTVPSGANNVNNGVAVDNTKASITGGTTSPTRMTMTDNAATFSRVSNGAPITVTGVADGKSDFDAVNVRQFAGAVAAVAAQANIPALAAGQDKTIGLGVGNFMGKTGLALGMNLRGEGNTTYKLSVSTGLNGGAKTVIGGGAAWSF